jgi:hypothetical protein
MKLSDLKVDAVKVEQGAWVENIPDMGDLRLKVRGVNNADWRRLQSSLIQAVPRGKRANGRIDPEEQDRITSICLQNASLLDWQNLHGDDGEPLPFSKEMARELLTKPEFRAFRDAVLYAATIVGEWSSEEIEADAKN